jgi:hypothetical protein
MTSAGTKDESVAHGDPRRAEDGGTAASSLHAAVSTALTARERVLAGASNARLIDALAATASEWREPDFAPRIEVITKLASQTCLHPEMLGRGLDHTLAALDESGMRALLSEAESAQALERPQRHLGRMQRLGGPPAVFYSLAGNVPALSIPVIAACVLARSVAIVRDSERQHGFTRAFVDTLARRDADAAAMIVPVSWASGDAALERAAFALAARIELYGSDATLRALAGRHTNARSKTVERGTRVSVGMVCEDSALESAAAGFAEDIVLYDGLGCLTPHVLFVVGPAARASVFARQLALQLRVFERRWPRRRRALDAEASRRACVDEMELSALSGSDEIILRGDDDAWVVRVGGAAIVTAGPGLRCVRAVACASDVDVITALRSSTIPIAAVGLAAGPHAASDQITAALYAGGATLVCPPGRMQSPPLTWAQDGRRRLGDLLTWTAVASDGAGRAEPQGG